jgi:hypothetical protein
MRRMDLRSIAYWVGVVALAITVVALLFETYDEIFFHQELRSALWRCLSTVLALVSLTLMLLNPPS